MYLSSFAYPGVPDLVPYGWNDLMNSYICY